MFLIIGVYIFENKLEKKYLDIIKNDYLKIKDIGKEILVKAIKYVTSKYKKGSESMKLEIDKIIKNNLGNNAKLDTQIETTNNSVFIVSSGEEKYIFKTYRSKNWPENGKLLYVNKLLDKNNIRYPKVIDYTRNHSYFENGYVLEEKIKGVPILDKEFDLEFGIKAYKLLANFVKKVHDIKFIKYGYINNGNPDYDKFSEYVKDTLEENLEILYKHEIIKEEEFTNISKLICDEFDKLSLTPVLTHGDLSMRNVIYNEGEVVLIDWDDAMAFPYEADIARMTFDMKFMHEDKYLTFRNAFLSEYLNSDNYKEYDAFEKLYHVFVACDWLVFGVQTNKKDTIHDDMVSYLKSLIKEIRGRK